jgi:hypothetical protein
MKAHLVFLLILLLAAGSSIPGMNGSSQQRERGLKLGNGAARIALVLGNGKYRVGPLKNPANDAHDMAQALKELGFDVIYGEDLSQSAMKRSIKEFGDKLGTGAIGLFYYAGHGTQIDGRNYLIPVDATVTTASEFIRNSVEVNLVLAQMERARSRVNIIILDACRNNPFIGPRSTEAGLASVKGASGTLIAYATAPDSVAADGEGRNGLYTSQLLNAMRTPGTRIEDVFKRVRINVEAKSNGRQIPWESTSLVQEFYFREPTPEQNLPTALKSFTQVDRTDALETARAVLQAYRARDIVALSEFCEAGNRRILMELVRDGERHPRYRSIWVTWRWQRAQAWDGRMDEVRYRQMGDGLRARAKFAESPEEVFVVTLQLLNGKWVWDDIHSPDRADYESESKVRPR